MSRTTLGFFATPHEQLRWLRKLLEEHALWCVIRKLPPQAGVDELAGISFLESLQLTKSDDIGGIQLFIGRKDVTPSPVWREHGAVQRDLDFIRSQAIQYDPSMVVRENVLLAGQMAIMRERYYKDSKIDFRSVHEWFREVCESFAEMTVRSKVFVQNEESGSEKECPEIVATSGAVEWQRSGRMLKQFLKGAYRFSVHD